MPTLKKNAPKKAKKARMQGEMDKFKKGSLKSSSGKKVTNPKQAIAIGLSESGQSKKKTDPSEKLLSRYKHHTSMADKHRANADLIEARLRVKGQKIDRWGDGPISKPVEPRIVKA